VAGQHKGSLRVHDIWRRGRAKEGRGNGVWYQKIPIELGKGDAQDEVILEDANSWERSVYGTNLLQRCEEGVKEYCACGLIYQHEKCKEGNKKKRKKTSQNSRVAYREDVGGRPKQQVSSQSFRTGRSREARLTRAGGWICPREEP